MIKCPKCGVEQEEGKNFCLECGAALSSFENGSSSEEIKDSAETAESETVESTEEVEASSSVSEEIATETTEEVPEEVVEVDEAINIEEEVMPITEETIEAGAPSEEGVEVLKEQEKVEQAETISNKSNKKKWGIIAIVVVLIIGIAGFFGYKYIAGRPVDVLGKVSVKFEGYNTVGSFSYNEKEIESLVTKAALKKAGISSKDAEGLVKEDKELLKKYKSDDKLSKKIEEAEKLVENLEIDITPLEDLTNGKKITFKIKDKNSNDKKIVKEDSKAFEIKGLKKIKNVSIEDLLKDAKYSFKGFNGYGTLDVEKNPYEKMSKKLFDEPSEDGKLSNDDSIKLKINSAITKKLLAEGKKLKGTDTIEVKVSDLTDPMAVGKLDECLAKIDELTKNYYDTVKLEDLDLGDIDYKSLGATMTFKVERQESYLRIDNNGIGGEAIFDIQSVYRVEATMSADGRSVSDSFYEVHGYKFVPVVGTDLFYEGLPDSMTAFEDSLEKAVAKLKTSHSDYQKIEKK